jgi:hypothetical protein
MLHALRRQLREQFAREPAAEQPATRHAAPVAPVPVPGSDFMRAF